MCTYCFTLSATTTAHLAFWLFNFFQQTAEIKQGSECESSTSCLCFDACRQPDKRLDGTKGHRGGSHYGPFVCISQGLGHFLSFSVIKVQRRKRQQQTYQKPFSRDSKIGQHLLVFLFFQNQNTIIPLGAWLDALFAKAKGHQSWVSEYGQGTNCVP